MTTTTGVDNLQRMVKDLLRCVAALEAAYGDTPAMHRIVNDAQQIRTDIERLGMDLAELGPAAVVMATTHPAAMIQIPDADYGVEFWRDVDHEGVGAQSLACVRRHA